LNIKPIYKNRWFFILSGLLVIIAGIFYFTKSTSLDETKLHPDRSLILETYQIDGGWAFKITRGGKDLIIQEQIPAVSGVQLFKSQSEANRIGSLMKFKIDKNIFPPSIFLKELDSLHINYSR